MAPPQVFINNKMLKLETEEKKEGNDTVMKEEGDNDTNVKTGDSNGNVKNRKSTLFTCLMWASFVMAISGVSKLLIVDFVHKGLIPPPHRQKLCQKVIDRARGLRVLGISSLYGKIVHPHLPLWTNSAKEHLPSIHILFF